MKMSKNILLLLCIILAFTVAAASCAREPATTTTTATTAADSTTTEEPTETETPSLVNPPGVFPIVNEPITLSVVIHEAAWGGAISDPENYATQYLEEMTGIKFDFTYITEPEQHQLLLASGDYPEVYFSSNFKNFEMIKYGTQEGILIPLNQYIEEYGETLKMLFAKYDFLESSITAPDGNIYGVPQLSDSLHEQQPYKFHINTDWLEKLDLDMPTTTDAFREVLEAFKTRDPNQTGRNDTVPLSGVVSWGGDPNVFLMSSFILTSPSNNYLLLDNGVMKFAPMEPMFVEGLKYVRDLYADGLIDPAAYTQDDAQFSQLGNHPDIILGCFAAGHVGMAIDFVNDLERSMMYEALPPLKGPEGIALNPSSAELRIGGYPFAITDKCEYPEAAFRISDILIGDEVWNMIQTFGKEDVDWVRVEPGKTGLMGGVAKFALINEEERGISHNRKWGGHVVLSHTQQNWHRDLMVVEDMEDIYNPDNYVVRLYRESEKYLPYTPDQIIPQYFVEEQLMTEINNMSVDIKTYVESTMLEFITGRKDIDNDWASFMNGLENMGISNFIELNQRAYDITVAGE